MRVWEEERAAGSPVLRAATLARLGGADRIVGTYLDDQMDRLAAGEQAVASAVFHQLVTPSGTKIAHSLGDLADYTGVPVAELRDVLDKLSAGDDWRILRAEAAGDGAAARTYEIFHDVLAEAVLDWRGRFEEQRAASEAVAAERSARAAAAAAGARGARRSGWPPRSSSSIARSSRSPSAARPTRRAMRRARPGSSARRRRSWPTTPSWRSCSPGARGSTRRAPSPALRAALTQYGTRGVLPSEGGPLLRRRRVAGRHTDRGGLRATGTSASGTSRGAASSPTARPPTGRSWARASARTGAHQSRRPSGDVRPVARCGRCAALRTLAARRRSRRGAALEPGRPTRRSPDGRRPPSVWDAGTGRLLRAFAADGVPVQAARWATSSRDVAIATVRRFEVRAVRRVARVLAPPRQPVIDPQVSRTGAGSSRWARRRDVARRPAHRRRPRASPARASRSTREFAADVRPPRASPPTAASGSTPRRTAGC